MTHTYERAAAERRVNAYLDFLMAAYGTDARGLADLAGVKPGAMTRFVNAPNSDRSTAILFSLVRLTGISASFLLAEEAAAEA